MIKTERLTLRSWKEDDLIPFARMNADPRVMEFFPSTYSKQQSDKTANMIIEHDKKHGFTFWAVETDDCDFIGMIGIANAPFKAFFTPANEIGWRLNATHWGKGYATEGANACLDYAFNELDLKEVVSFTTEKNLRSRRVMEKIRMKHDPKEVFDHPKLSKEHPLSRHVLYRKTT